MGASRSQQVGLVFVLAVALYVPHTLHNRLLARVEADTEAAAAMMEDLYKQSQQQQQDLQKVSAQKADVEKELEAVRESKKYDQDKFQEVQAGDCGALKLEQEFRARLDSEHKKLNTESEPRLHQLDLEANSLRHSSQEEIAEMDSTLPRLQAQEEELRKSKTERMAEVQLGANLRDNDSGFVKQWVQRVLTMDLFMGPFLMNQINAPLLDHSIVMPKWKAESDTVGKATQDLKDNLPKMDPFLKPRPVLYHSCAVVGTSGNLLYYRSGASIDAHDAVFRFNAATTLGFEEFVGSKTTVRFTDRANFGFHERDSEIVLQLVTNPHTFEKYVTHRKENPGSRVFMVAPEFHLHVVSDLVGPASPAFYGVLFALQRCQEVELFGFARSGNDEAPYHYYNAEQPEEAELKREQQEEALVKELLRRTDGRMRVMEPCALEEDCEGELNCRYCAHGSRCICGKSMPVAKMGFCMESGVADCFYACEEPNECPGGESYTICAEQAKGSECAKA